MEFLVGPGSIIILGIVVDANLGHQGALRQIDYLLTTRPRELHTVKPLIGIITICRDNGTVGICVDRVHSTNYGVLSWMVLYDTESIYPEIPLVQRSHKLYGIANGLWN